MEMATVMATLVIRATEMATAMPDLATAATVMATPEVILVTAMETRVTAILGMAMGIPATAVVPAEAILEMVGETEIQVRAATAKARTNNSIFINSLVF